jgi:outer membrane lipoprotein LolB
MQFCPGFLKNCRVWSRELGVKKCRVVVGLLLVLLISGCGMQRPVASKTFTVQAPLKRQAELAQLKYWEMKGAFSIQQQNQSAEIAHYDWQQKNQDYHITILSALNLYRVDIARVNGVVKLWKNGALSLTAKTPEDLLLQAVGWSLPVRNLQWWMKGMIAPQQRGAYHVKYDQFGHLIELKQNGWALLFEAYQAGNGQPDYPQRITLTRPGLKVTIVVKQLISA